VFAPQRRWREGVSDWAPLARVRRACRGPLCGRAAGWCAARSNGPVPEPTDVGADGEFAVAARHGAVELVLAHSAGREQQLELRRQARGDAVRPRGRLSLFASSLVPDLVLFPPPWLHVLQRASTTRIRYCPRTLSSCTKRAFCSPVLPWLRKNTNQSPSTPKCLAVRAL